MLAALSLARGQHPPHEMDNHERFYRYLTRPDQPPVQGTCCGNMDCYATAARFRNGHWEAIQRETKLWVVIPDERVVRREDELALRPTNQAFLCATTGFIYCFVAPLTDG